MKFENTMGLPLWWLITCTYRDFGHIEATKELRYIMRNVYRRKVGKRWASRMVSMWVREANAFEKELGA